jgi:acyl carrier protein
MQKVSKDFIADLIVQSSGGSVTLASLREADGDLRCAGYKSVDLLTLLENLERKLGIAIDPNEDPAFLTSIQSITVYARAALSV